jgi:branched-chain amino acid transport system permease protein
MRTVAVRAGLLCAVVVAAAALGQAGDPRLVRATGTALIMLVLVLGLNIFIGNSGVFSFGHLAFMGVGAYVTVIARLSEAQKSFQLPDLPGGLAGLELSGPMAVLVSGAVAAACAAVLAAPVVRLSGLTASLATFAILIAANSVFENWETVTRGSAGLILDADPPGIWTLVLWACLAVVVAVGFQRTRTGVRLTASREDEIAARAVGIRVWAERGAAFVLSAFVVGAAGSLFAQYFSSLNPDSFFLTLTFTAIAILVVGGLTTVTGAVAGTLVVSVALELLRLVERGVYLGGWKVPSRSGLAEVGLALVLLGVLVVRPLGITGGHEIDRLLRRRRPRPPRRRTPAPEEEHGHPARTA